MKFEFEIELNREWIYDNKGNIIGETNFVVPIPWLKKMFNKHYHKQYNTFGDFINAYVPEEEGEFLYKIATRDNVMKYDFGAVMY